MKARQLMEQARRMRARIEEAQAGLADVERSASAGGGAVRATATADGRLASVTIAPDLCDPADVELLQDLVLAAANGALAAAQRAADETLAGAVQDLRGPGA